MQDKTVKRMFLGINLVNGPILVSRHLSKGSKIAPFLPGLTPAYNLFQAQIS